MLGRRSLKRKLSPEVVTRHREEESISEVFNEEESSEEYSVHEEGSETQSSSDESVHVEMAANGGENHPRNMRDFARPILEPITSPIVLGPPARNYELKNIHFNMLPSFYGLPNEDALSFIREFYSVTQTIPLNGLNEDQLKMRCFPYTLKDKAKQWFLTLPSNSLTTWKAVYDKFMERYYSNQKTQDLRSQLVTFVQSHGETFHEAWERFKGLLR